MHLERVTAQTVRYPVFYPFSVVNFKIIFIMKLGHPPVDSSAQSLALCRPLQTAMVCDHIESFSASEKFIQFLYRPYYREGFLLSGVVVLLCLIVVST